LLNRGKIGENYGDRGEGEEASTIASHGGVEGGERKCRENLEEGEKVPF